MPSTQALSDLFTRSITNTTSSPALQVVCAFPLSSNYGPGSRILYYVLVAACVAFRKAEWLRNACLAAALVLPAIAALHALVIVSAHVNGAVDMDIYGAFQICAIGILAAPLTVRLSRTYFYDPGRNIIFLWTVLILMGLIALCVEFYRVTQTGCSYDDSGNPISPSAAKFPYSNATCGLTCSVDLGPFSPLRGGANNNIYVIPVPRILTFNALMLLAAGFCIPAILSLIFTWDKILEINWKRRRVEQLDDQIEGANITVREMRGINNVVRLFLSVVEIPLFGGVIITLICIGEANFYSSQVRYQTEPMASIGQWSSIAGTTLAALGSLYLLWSADGAAMTEKPRIQHSNSIASRRSHSSERQPSANSSADIEHSPSRSQADNALGIRSASPHEFGLIPTITQPDLEQEQDQESHDTPGQEDGPTAGRHKVREWFTSAGNYLGNAAHEKLDVSDDNDQKVSHKFPEIPGEPLRNSRLERVSTQYSRLREENSRTGSPSAASVASASGIEGSSTSPPARESPRPDSPVRTPQRRATLEVPPQVHGYRRNESQ